MTEKELPILYSRDNEYGLSISSEINQALRCWRNPLSFISDTASWDTKTAVTIIKK